MLNKKLPAFLLALLLSAVVICPCIAFAEETDAEPPAEESFSVLDAEALDREIESIITSMNRDKKTVSVALYFTGTGETYYYNADRWWYTASLFKLPLTMKVASMQKNGELDPDALKLNADLETIKRKILVYSDNSWAYGLQEKVFHDDLAYIRGNDLSYSIGFDEKDLPAKFYKSYLYSARFFLGIVRELYENSEEYPHVLEYMLEASPTKYFHRVLEDRYAIAQKYGSAGHVCHAGGIIYTPDPVLLVVMNSGVEDLAGNKMIGEISARVAALAEDWHAELEEQKAEAAKQKESAPVKPAEEKPAQPSPTPEPEPEPAPAPAEPEASSHWGGILACAAVALVAVLILIVLLKKKTSAPEEEVLPDAEDGEADSFPEEEVLPEVPVEVIPKEERQS